MKRRVRQLLPIKTERGFVPQSRVEEEEEEPIEDSDGGEQAAEGDAQDSESMSASDAEEVGAEEGDSDVDGDASMADEEQLAPVEQMALAAAKFNEAKAGIANLAQAVIENPELHIGNLRKLRLLLGQKLYKRQPILSDYVVVSLCEVYKDILPSYKIRVATEAEKQQQAKKETKRLRAYEETLLLNYQKYTRLLRCGIRGPGDQRASGGSAAKRRRKAQGAEVQYANRAVAVRCTSQLVAAHPYFNESHDLAAALVPCLNDNDAGVSGPVGAAFRQLFAEDTRGEASFHLTKALVQFAHSRRLRVHSEFLQVFTALNIQRSEFAQQQQRQQQQSRKQRKEQTSRSQRRAQKRDRSLTENLQQLQAQEDAARRSRLHQRIVEMLMHLYLKVLKQAPSSRLLSSVLDGLCQFGQLVNLELMSELLQSLGGLLSQTSLSAADSLRAVRVAMSLLSGEGEALTLDPREFYLQLYRRLGRIVQAADGQLALVLLQLLRHMLIDRKRQLPAQRPISFVQRLVSVCCCQQRAPAPTVAATLCAAGRLMLVFPRAAELVDDGDGDGDGGRLGSLLPIGDDPDLPRPTASVAADLRRLAAEHHDAAVRRVAATLLRRRFSDLPPAESLLQQQ